MSAASLRETPMPISNGPVLEKALLSVEVMTVPGAKVGLGAPIGPVTSILAALDGELHPVLV